MKRIVLSFFSAIFIGYSAMAQFHLELGLNFNSPTSDFSDTYKLGAGAYLESKYAVTENIDLGLYLGANGFAASDIGTTSGKVDATLVTPVLASGTYRFLANNITPYAGVGAGMYLAKVATFSESALGGSESKEKNVTEFGFAPRLGVYIGRMNIGAVYNMAGDITFWQFNLGVRILDRD